MASYNCGLVSVGYYGAVDEQTSEGNRGSVRTADFTSRNVRSKDRAGD